MKNSTYDQELFEAYIATPNKFEWYKRAFEHFDANGGKASWYWNSWAMVGGFWYFLYRKQMNIALIVLFVTLLLSSVLPIVLTLYVVMFLSIAMGGFGTYFIYKQYHIKKDELENILKDEKKSIIMMKYQIGGVNRWAIPLSIVSLISFISIVAGLIMMSQK